MHDEYRKIAPKTNRGEIIKIVKPKIKTIRAEKYDEHPIKYIQGK